MNSQDELFEKYRAVSLGVPNEPGTDLYLSLTDAFDFLHSCEEEGFAIGRIEGFGYKDGNIHQRLDLIWEFEPDTASWAEYRRQCNDAAFKVLSELSAHNKQKIVSFVLESEQDWSEEKGSESR